MPLTNYSDQKLNQLLLGATAFTAPANVYAALSTTTPTNAGGSFTEPVGNGYTRVTVANNSTSFHAFGTQPPTGQQQSNAIVISFPTVTGTGQTWGTITYWGLFDAASAGNLLGFGAMTTQQVPNSGDTLSFAVDAMTMTLT